MGHLDGQHSSGTCTGITATLAASCQGGGQCKQEQGNGMFHKLLGYGLLYGSFVVMVYKIEWGEEGKGELKELSAFQA